MNDLKTVDAMQKGSPSIWKLVWRRFTQHKLGLLGGMLLIVLGVLAVFADSISPYQPGQQYRSFGYAPPTPIHFFSEEGFSLQPFVYGVKRGFDQNLGVPVFTEDKTQKFPIKLFAPGDKYRFLGLFETDIHLFGTGTNSKTSLGQLFLFGTDKFGRDVFSRILAGSRISLSIGPLVILISFILGVLFGGISGYYGGWVDGAIQRVTEVTMAMPRLALLLAFATVIPAKADPIVRFWIIVLVLALVSWAPITRVMRGQFLALREEDFSTAAKALGASDLRVILRHILPNTTTYLIVAASLTVPNVLILESALSFFSYGIQEPLVSWGMLMAGAQSVFEIEFHPWLLIPGFFIVFTVLAYNFLGDALRDAADPFTIVVAKD